MDQIPLGGSWTDSRFSGADGILGANRHSGLSTHTELLQETGSRGPLEKLGDQLRNDQTDLFAVGSSNSSSQLSVEMVPAGSTHASLELSLVASPQASVDGPQPISSQFSLEDLYSFCTPSRTRLETGWNSGRERCPSSPRGCWCLVLPRAAPTTLQPLGGIPAAAAVGG